MNREDYLTHLLLALAFFGILSPFLFEKGISLGSGLYYAGTTAHLTLASMARLFMKE